MKNKGQLSLVGQVRFERLLPGPIERVWDFLTQTELLPAWFGNGTIEPRVGGEVSLMDGHIRGTVTQWQPPNKLVYTWNVFSPGEKTSAYPESYLTLELQPEGEQVRLTLTHIPIPEPFQKQTMMGWHTFLDIVEAGVRGEEPQSRDAYFEANARLYDVDMNRLTK